MSKKAFNQRHISYNIESAILSRKNDLLSYYIHMNEGILKNEALANELLERSIAINNKTALKILLEEGANPNLRNVGGIPVIFSLTGRERLNLDITDHKEMAKMLIDAGADVNLPHKNEVMTLMHVVDNADMAEFYIDKGFDLSSRKVTNSIISFKTINGCEDVVEVVKKAHKAQSPINKALKAIGDKLAM